MMQRHSTFFECCFRACVRDTSPENEELQSELLNVQDIVDQKDFEIEQLRAATELETLRSMVGSFARGLP